MQLVLQFMTPETLARWNLAAHSLPTRQTAVDYWGTALSPEDSYVAFADQQLSVVRPRPVIPNYARTAAALQQAVEDVVSGVASPEEAAAWVMDTAQ
jgi:maltose-binding protein MalE